VWACNKCKEKIEEQFDSCWSCGKERGTLKDDSLKDESFKKEKKEVEADVIIASGGLTKNALNMSIFAGIIFVISFFMPYLSIGQLDVTLIKLATETENTDWIGVLILGIGSLMLMMGSDKKISLVLTIIGGFFPLYRFYKITFAGDFGALTPSFTIGGYLILLAVIIQLYACLSSPDTVSESAKTKLQKPSMVDNKNIPFQIRELSKLKDEGILSEKEFEKKKKDLLDKM
jgi:hypothetical protein